MKGKLVRACGFRVYNKKLIRPLLLFDRQMALVRDILMLDCPCLQPWQANQTTQSHERTGTVVFCLALLVSAKLGPPVDIHTQSDTVTVSDSECVCDEGDTESVFYAETRPPVLWTGKTKCGRVLICLDGSVDG